MTEHPEAPTHSGLLNPEHYADYLVRDAGEIALMLRRMHDHRVLLNVFIDGGSYRFVSAVLESGPRGLILDASPDEWLNTHAIAADVLTCTAQLDGVRVQFDVGDTRSINHDKLPALLCSMPKAMLRLQRRETYRLAVPMRSPVGCQITRYPPECEGGDGATAEPLVVRPRVVDISMDGIALLLQADELPLSVGMELEDCLISLPESESAKLRLKVRNLHQTTNPNGVRAVRAGCEMLGVPNRFSTQIQRYIFKIERERRMMESSD